MTWNPSRAGSLYVRAWDSKGESCNKSGRRIPLLGIAQPRLRFMVSWIGVWLVGQRLQSRFFNILRQLANRRCSCAIAQRKPASSRAIAVTTFWDGLPRARSARNRRHSRSSAFSATALNCGATASRPNWLHWEPGQRSPSGCWDARSGRSHRSPRPRSPPIVVESRVAPSGPAPAEAASRFQSAGRSHRSVAARAESLPSRRLCNPPRHTDGRFR